MAIHSDKFIIEPTVDTNPFTEYKGTEATDDTKNISFRQGDGLISGPKRKYGTNYGWKFVKMLKERILATSYAISAHFDGASYADLAWPIQPYYCDNFTMSVWIYCDDLSNSDGLDTEVVLGAPGGRGNTMLGLGDIGSGQVAIDTWGAGGRAYGVTAQSVFLGKWNNIIITQSDTSVVVYINNYFFFSSGNGRLNPVSRIGFGGAGQASNYFKGRIEGLYFWARLLDSSERAQVFNSGVGVYGNIANAPFNSGIYAIYNLDSTWNDTSGNADHMTNHGGTFTEGMITGPNSHEFNYDAWTPLYIPDTADFDCTNYTNQTNCQSDDCCWANTGACSAFTSQTNCNNKSGCTWHASYCSDFNGSQESCQGHQGCTWDSADCSVFTDSYNCGNNSGCYWNTNTMCSGLSGKTACQAHSSCTWIDCSDYTDSSSCGYQSSYGCYWSANMQSCGGFYDSTSCYGHSGCSWGYDYCSNLGTQNVCDAQSYYGCYWVYPTSCSTYNTDPYNCNNQTGCTWNNWSSCASYNNDQTNCLANGCNWDYTGNYYCYGNADTCTGSFGGNYCAGNQYQYCSGSWDDGSCLGGTSCNGTYDYCSGSYYPGTCSGYYNTYCSGTYYHCVNNCNC